MKLRISTVVTALAASILFTGCASTPNISLDKSKTGAINSLDLLKVNESQRFMILNMSGLPAVGGIIGGAIAGNVAEKRAAQFVEAYNAAGGSRLSTALVSDLQREFSASGKSVNYLPDEFAKIKGGKDDYSHIKTDKDAVLSVWFGGVGYVADGTIDAPFEPWVVVHVRLLDGKSKQVLSQKTYSAGYKGKIDGAVFVPCAKDVRYDAFDKLAANFAQAIDALSDCEKAIAQQAVRDLI